MVRERIAHRDPERLDPQQTAEGSRDAPELHAGQPLGPEEGGGGHPGMWSGLSLDDYILGSWLAHFLSESTGSPLLMKSTLCVNKTRITDDFNIYIQMILSCGSQRGH